MNSKRAVPVKMIWMFVCLSLAMMSFVFMASVNPSIRIPALRSIFSTFMVTALLCVGAGVCFSRSCINLALPGIALMSMMLCAGLANTGLTAFPAILVAVFAGSILGAITGLFAIQKRRSVPLVTALSTMAIGAILTCLSNVITEGTYIRVAARFQNAAVPIIIGLVMTLAVCFLGAIGGKKAFATNTVDGLASGGAGRFVWMTVAGALAGFAGAYQAVNYGAANGTFFNNHNLTVIFPTLIIAGALIPNARRGVGEAIFGLLAVFFAALAYAFFQMSCSILGSMAYVPMLVHSIVALLFMIPNLLIYRKLGGDAPAQVEPAPTSYSPAVSDRWAGVDSYERTVPRASDYAGEAGSDWNEDRYARTARVESRGWSDGEKTARVDSTSDDYGEKTARVDLASEENGEKTVRM